MADTSTAVANEALITLGKDEIDGLDDGSASSAIINRIYPSLKRYALSKTTWRFSRRKAKLTLETAPPVNAWERQFLMPGDNINSGVLGVYMDGTSGARKMKRGWEVFGQRLFTNQLEIWIDYQYDVPEGNWPAYFHLFFVNLLIARLAGPIAESNEKAQIYNQIAVGTPQENQQGGLFAEASAIDAQQGGQVLIDSGDLVEHRWSSGVDHGG